MFIGKVVLAVKNSVMSGISDDHLAHFKAESDKAFLEMQRDADQAYADFLKQYGGEFVMTSSSAAAFASAPSSYPLAPGPSAKPASPVRTNPKPGRSVSKSAVNQAEKLYEAAPAMELGGLRRDAFDDSVNDVREDLGALSKNLREESRAAARDAMKGTSDILRGKASGLGQKAKEEAARLKEAMRKAMEEERNLRSMKGRAQQELSQAKQRFKSHVEDAKDDTLSQLKNMARGSADSFKDKAMDAFEDGQASVEREWKDFISGQDS